MLRHMVIFCFRKTLNVPLVRGVLNQYVCLSWVGGGYGSKGRSERSGVAGQ